jgi:hypothetical protein
MRYLPSLSKEEPAVGGDNPADEISTARTPDPEKEAIDHDETLRTAVVHHGDSAIERRVVRKLDWRLVPIVMGLCE